MKFECVGQAAGSSLQDGLGDREGGVFAYSQRIVADRDGNHACGGRSGFDGVALYARVSSADAKVDEDRELVWVLQVGSQGKSFGSSRPSRRLALG
ncbi:hypothetical protein MPNT_80090 [Candidatus Methylacidithermus pantelleriae]|uniref:Uncharacterized protein n=1 Tax=Candidatus Methylacidithermus pantelleriae TaxID=2744239 RepID=A0A8J2BSX9_9BACT|nr:hypothetical protein MPNT_690002 [Candidatus Methylacidithermus pantelleriae]CAF0705060.1 hypothetical protein MPNT_80090 [Candidatus Methylacidithermus pantelleriae]